MLTPMDIHNKDFKRTIRGYSTNEVDEFLDRIVSDYEKLFRENDKLKEQASLNDKEISQYRKLEKNLQDTLMMAQNTADEILAAAKKNAEDLIETAKRNAEDVMNTAQKNADGVTSTARRNADELMSTTTKTVEETKASVERECNSLREQAKLDAQRQLDEANTKLRSIMAEYEKVVRDKNAFLMRIRSALESELAVTNQMLSSVPHHEAVKAHTASMASITTMESMSALSNVPLPTLTPKNDALPSNPQPVAQPKPPAPKPSSEKAVDPEDMDKTAVFVKSPRVK